MSLIYVQADFEGVIDDDYLAQEPSRRSMRGSTLVPGLAGLQNQKILIAGCGFGGLVDELMDNWGFTDVWGFDASSFAVGRNTYPERQSRILQFDALRSQDMTPLRRAAGLTGNQRFRLVIIEDLLPCMANMGEVQTCLTNMRGISQTVAHVITMWEPDSWGVQEDGSPNTFRDVDGSIKHVNGGRVISMPGFLWLTAAEWLEAIGTSSEWVYTSAMQRVQ